MSEIPNWLKREEALLGSSAVMKLQASKVVVIGLGGVGSYVAEALARAGVGTLILMDGDVVDETNINRQLVATSKTIGQSKAEVMKARVLDINPHCHVEAITAFYNEETDSSIFDRANFVADAIDMVSAKISLIATCKEKNIPVISAMGCGNKLNPMAFKVEDIAKTKMDPLCRVMRRELRLRGIDHVPVVYSEEPAIMPKETEDTRTLASISFVPSAAGLLMAGFIIKEITKEED